MKLVFIGYMASGKSAIAKEVSKRNNLELVDLDSYIETQVGMSISELFAQKGEVYFRKKEKECLEQLLTKEHSLLLSVGGGTPCFAGNMEIILANATSVYLKASIQTICDRLVHGKATRPLVADIADTDMPEFVGKHLFERAFFYEKASHIVTVDKRSIDAIATEVIGLLAH